MDSLVRNFNTDENFWETNPTFLTVSLFKDFHKSDRSKDKNKSSKVMWAIAFLVDPHEHNVWRNLSDEDKRKLIKEDFIGDDFEFEEYEGLIKEYYNRALTMPEKDFLELIDKLHERAIFIKRTPYTLEDNVAKTLDAMILATSKMYDQLETVKDKLERSKQIQGETKGGRQESASEEGLL